MRLTIILSGIIALVLFSIATKANANACVDCHRALTPATHLAHDFSEWERSAHAKAAITCEQCHGGNPSERDPQKAHKGFVVANQPKSPLYFTNIPETCGGCHQAEFKAFQQSYHYKELRRSGHGPNCLTCHNAMSTSILTPAALEQSCAVCHTQRSQASEALVTLNLAGSALQKWEHLVMDLKERGKIEPSDEARLSKERERYRTVQERWHAFRLREVIDESHRLVTTTNQEIQRLKLKRETR